MCPRWLGHVLKSGPSEKEIMFVVQDEEFWYTQRYACLLEP